VGLKLNETHQLLVYTDDANLLGDNIDNIKKNTETLIDARKEVGQEIFGTSKSLTSYTVDGKVTQCIPGIMTAAIGFRDM
jgi:hypothetical protein